YAEDLGLEHDADIGHLCRKLCFDVSVENAVTVGDGYKEREEKSERCGTDKYHEAVPTVEKAALLWTRRSLTVPLCNFTRLRRCPVSLLFLFVLRHWEICIRAVFSDIHGFNYLELKGLERIYLRGMVGQKANLFDT